MSKNAFIAPVSFSQYNLWIAEQFKTQANAYHICTAYKIEGDLNIPNFEKSINKIVERHEILRASFRVKGGAPVLFIEPEKELTINCIDLNGSVWWENHEKIKELLFQKETEPLNLTTGPLLRITLFKMPESSYLMLLEIHHIICDGWSLSIFMKELFHFYNEFISGNERKLPELRIQYPDYTSWEKQVFESGDLNEDIAYWKNQLKDSPMCIQIPTDYPRSLTQTNNGALEFFELSPELSLKLRQLSQKSGATLFMTLLAGLGVMLSRYSQQTDIIIGTTVANRKDADLENLIGFFVDFVALRIDCNGQKKFSDFLEHVKEVTLDGFSHDRVPFSKLIDVLEVKRDPALTPIFQVMFILQNTPVLHTKPHGFNIEPYKNNTLASKYDISIEIRDSSDQIGGLFQYNTDLFDKMTIRRMIGMFIKIMDSITLDTRQLLENIDCLNKSELHDLKFFLNDTVVKHPDSDTLMDLFETAAKNHCNNTAIVFEDINLTYQALDERSEKFANFLRTMYSLKCGELVAVKMERSERMIVAILGILKCGAAYLPLDMTYPQSVLQLMLDDSKSRIVIDEQFFQVFHEKQTSISANKVVLKRSNNDLIAVLYTTGSTGIPKGVPITNANLLNRLYWMWMEFPFVDHEVCAAKTSFSFVDHMWELFGPLLKGIKVVMFDKLTIVNAPLFIAKLGHYKVTRIVLVPSLLKELLKHRDLCVTELKHLLEWTCSGEALDSFLVKKFYSVFPDRRLLNIYGSTEVMADATYYDTSRADEINPLVIPLGKPIHNTKIYIMDSAGNLLPRGAIGEICVSGLGVVNGYLGNESLTALKFFNNPFLEGDTLYKTGDLGRWLIDGNIEFSGRNDYQVKIMGNRIELLEIENNLMNMSGVDNAIVMSRENEKGNKVLMAYVVGNEPLNSMELRLELSERLPSYMLPTFFLQIEKFPLTSNGKVDRKALESTSAIPMKSKLDYVAPAEEIEKKLVRLWSKILDIPYEQIGLLDNFFELGGDSIKLLLFISEFNKEFSFELTVTNIFQHVNIKSQIEFLMNENKDFAKSDSMALEARDLLMDTLGKLSHN